MLFIVSLLATVVTFFVTTVVHKAVFDFETFVGCYKSIQPTFVPRPLPTPPPPLPQANWSFIETWAPPTLLNTVPAFSPDIDFASASALTPSFPWTLFVLGLFAAVLVSTGLSFALSRLPTSSINPTLPSPVRAPDAVPRVLEVFGLLVKASNSLDNLREKLAVLEGTVAKLTDRLRVAVNGLALGISKHSEVISRLEARIAEQDKIIAHLASCALTSDQRDETLSSAARLADLLAELRAEWDSRFASFMAQEVPVPEEGETWEEKPSKADEGETAPAPLPSPTVTSDEIPIDTNDAASAAAKKKTKHVARSQKAVLRAMRAEGDALQARVDELRRTWLATNPSSLEFPKPSESGKIPITNEGETRLYMQALHSEIEQIEKRMKCPALS